MAYSYTVFKTHMENHQSVFPYKEGVRMGHWQKTLFPEIANNKKTPDHPTMVLSPHVSFSSVRPLSRVWLCDPMNRSTPGLPVHHQLRELKKSLSLGIFFFRPNFRVEQISIFLSWTWEAKVLFQWLLVSWKVPAPLGISLPARLRPLSCELQYQEALLASAAQTRMHSHLKLFLSTYYKSGSFLGTGDIAERKQKKGPRYLPSWSLHYSGERWAINKLITVFSVMELLLTKRRKIGNSFWMW